MQANHAETPFCFVLSPQSKRFVNLWDAVLEPAIASCGMKAVRTSDISERYDNLMEGIRKHIMDAKAIIAVLDSDDGLSIMYELGLAHAAKKPVIVLLEKNKDVPQVFSHLSLLRYDADDFPGIRIELIRRLQAVGITVAEDLFPELPIRTQAELEEYHYLKLKRKKLIITVTPACCSIFFNNRFLGVSPQIIHINPDAERNVISISAAEHFEYYQALEAKDMQQSELPPINLEPRDASKYPKRVNSWLMRRRQDPDNPVLSLAIGRYLSDDQRDFDAAREEALFCIAKAPEWFGGHNLLGLIENQLGNHDKAIEYFRQVGNLNPNDFLSGYNVACSFSLNRNYAAALNELDKIIANRNLHKSLKDICKATNRPYWFEKDTDFDGLRQDEKYKAKFAEKIAKLVEIVASPEPALITQPSQDIHNNPSKNTPQPYAIKQLIVEHFQCIKRLELRELPIDSSWILITGDNADGKTSLLQALAIGLNGTQDAENLLKPPDCKIDVEISVQQRSELRHFYWKEDHWRLENGANHEQIEPCKNLLAYGPARLDIQGEMSLRVEREQSGPLHSLLQQQGNLLNIETWLKDQVLELAKQPDKMILQRMEKVKSLLVDLMPNVSEIEIDGSQIKYREKGHEIEAHHLSAGHKSILATIGDMLIRLFQTQPDIVDPAELQGIVIIDELDVHLHPKWQRQLPTLLSERFPNIQFVASTHSVIPFLGAPPGSVFLKVSRDPESGTSVEKLDIDIANLLPNSLLTSPLFGLEKITHSHNQNFAAVRTEDDYAEIERRKQRDERLKALAQKAAKSA